MEMIFRYIFQMVVLYHFSFAASPQLMSSSMLPSQLADTSKLTFTAHHNKTNDDKTATRKAIRKNIRVYLSKNQFGKAADSYHELANSYLVGADLEAKVKCLQQALKLYKLTKDLKNQALTLKSIAALHHDQGQNHLAVEELQRSLQILNSINYKDTHIVYDLLSTVNQTLGNYPEALRYRLSTIESARTKKDYRLLSFYYKRLGIIYFDLKQYDQALKHYDQAHKYADKSGNNSDVIGALSLAVNILLQQQKPQESLHLIEKVTKDFPPSDLKSNAMVTLFKAQCHIALKNFSEGEKNIIRAEQYLGEIKKTPEVLFINDSFSMGVYQVGAELYIANKVYSKARYFINKSIEVNRRVKFLGQAALLELFLFKVDSAEGNYKKAIQHYQQYKVLEDSIFNETKSKQIANLEVQFKTKEHEKDINLLTQKNLVQQAILKQKDLQQAIIIFGTLILLLLLLLLYNRYRMKKRSNLLLQSKQQEIDLQNEYLQQLLKEKEGLLSNKDLLLEEKEWLLKEVHHRVKNNLQIVMSLLNSQASFMQNGDALSAIHQSQHRLYAISLIHQKLYQSENVACIDLEGYIRDLVDYLCEFSGNQGRVCFRLEILPLQVDGSIAVPLGLIINEAVTNCLKYAFPDGKKGQVVITLKALQDGSSLLLIEDNGVGFSKNFDINQTRSLGMNLLKGLSKQLKGNLKIQNKDGLKISLQFNQITATKIYDLEATSL